MQTTQRYILMQLLILFKHLETTVCKWLPSTAHTSLFLLNKSNKLFWLAWTGFGQLIKCDLEIKYQLELSSYIKRGKLFVFGDFLSWKGANIIQYTILKKVNLKEIIKTQLLLIYQNISGFSRSSMKQRDPKGIIKPFHFA